MGLERLYELAFQYKKTKLWEKISDSHIFAIRLSDKQMGYIAVTGANGEFHGISLYIGDQGFRSFRTMWEAEKCLRFDLPYSETLMTLKCLQCTFEKKDGLDPKTHEQIKTYARSHGIRLAGKYAYPLFWKYEPYDIPWHLQTPQEEEWLCQALAAAIEMAGFLEGTSRQEFDLEAYCDETTEIHMLEERGGPWLLDKTKLHSKEPVIWPKPEQCHEDVIAPLKNAKKQGVWQCGIVRVMEPVQEGPDTIPGFPVMLLAVDEGSRHILPVMPVMHYEENPDALLDGMLKAFARQGVCPEGFKVSDERTMAFVKGCADRLGIPAAMVDELPELWEAREDFLEKVDVDEDLLDEIMDLLQLSEKKGGQEKKKKAERKKTADESYVISVSLGKGCYRHIRISGKCTLWDLHSAILDAFEFFDDHAHAFFMDNVKWSDRDSYYMKEVADGQRTTEKRRIGSVGLYKGMAFKYIFDFGDEWTFQCKVLRTEPGDSGEPQVIKMKGEAPAQYRDWDEDWDEE